MAGLIFVKIYDGGDKTSDNYTDDNHNNNGSDNNMIKIIIKA